MKNSMHHIYPAKTFYRVVVKGRVIGRYVLPQLAEKARDHYLRGEMDKFRKIPKAPVRRQKGYVFYNRRYDSWSACYNYRYGSAKTKQEAIKILERMKAGTYHYKKPGRPKKASSQ